MQIDITKPEKEILEDIYKHTINDLEIEFPFKPEEEFEKWYNAGEKSIIFPHPEIDEPDAAVSSSHHPYIFVSCNEGKIGLGIAFRSAASIGINLMGVCSKKNRKNRKWVLDNFKSLKDEGNWKFGINRIKQDAKTVKAMEKKCGDINADTLNDILEKLSEWPKEWEKEANAEDVPSSEAVVNFMSTVVTPEELDESVKTVFNTYSTLAITISAPVLHKEWKAQRKAVEEFIGELENRLGNGSQFEEAIVARIEEQKSLLVKIDQDFREG